MIGSASILLASSGMLPDALSTCSNSYGDLPRGIMSSAAS
jgi:hypothetical protein